MPTTQTIDAATNKRNKPGSIKKSIIVGYRRGQTVTSLSQRYGVTTTRIYQILHVEERRIGQRFVYRHRQALESRHGTKDENAG